MALSFPEANGLPDIVEDHEDEEDGYSLFSTTDVSLPEMPRSELSSSPSRRLGNEAGADLAVKGETFDIEDENVYEKEISENEDYDTDIEIEEKEPDEEEIKKEESVGAEAYKESCARLNISPEIRVMANLASTTLNLAYQGLGEDGAKALAKSLMKNTKVQKLQLEDNCITPLGATFLFDMLSDNIHITYLDLSQNDVGTYGCIALKEMLLSNTTLLTLILNNCKIKDSDCAPLAEGLQSNDMLVYLDLSHNELCEEGAMHLGNAIAMNNSVEQLSIAWNHIRRKGAVQICKGLKRNYCLVKLDMSWNGLGYEGALSLGQALKVNKYLKELDVSNNRLTWDCATVVASGLKDNFTLEVLKIGNNPLTMTGVLELLSAVNNEHSELEYLSFEGIPINRKIAFIAETLSNNRDFSMNHGGVIDSDDVMGKKIIPEDDPLTRLLAFLNDRGVRAVDLFRSFETDKDKLVSREQFISGLKKVQSPLETWEIIEVMNKLDKTENGKINYRKLSDGIHEQKVFNKKKADQAKAEAKRKIRDEKKLLNPELSISRSSSTLPSTNGSVQNSRRASRVSSLTQNQLEMRRSSTVSLRSTAVSPGRRLSNNLRNPLPVSVETQQKHARQGEITRKLNRLTVASDGRSQPSSGRLSMT